MRNFAIIPARRGSKSIKNKNLLQLTRGENLVERAIRQAKETRLFHEIIVTTNIPYFYDAVELGATVHHREERLCYDETLMIYVVQDVIEKFNIKDQDWVWLLQPTAPFREKRHFFAIQKLVLRDVYKGIISIKDVGANHPDRMYTRKDSKIYRLHHTSYKNKQDLLDMYIRNGAFYVFRTDHIMSKQGFESIPQYGYIMEEKESINIDGPWDLQLAKWVINEDS